MRVPLSWLREYVDIALTPEQLAERLTLLGMEVKGIEQWGADWRSVVVGELLTVEKHPYADRLHLTTVNVGSGEPLHIVCGANNIAPGQRVPVALPGAVLPGERRIERTEKMGIASEGMLCSGDELHITSDAEGILILPPSTPLGIQLSDLYGDVVLDVDVKPNRGDALCLIGLAREVAAATGIAVSRVNNYLHGKYRTIRPDHLGALAAASGKTSEERSELVRAYLLDLLPASLQGTIRIESVGEGVQVLARHDGAAVLARSDAIWVASFHPELSGDLRLHEWFLTESERR